MCSDKLTSSHCRFIAVFCAVLAHQSCFEDRNRLQVGAYHLWSNRFKSIRIVAHTLQSFWSCHRLQPVFPSCNCSTVERWFISVAQAWVIHNAAPFSAQASNQRKQITLWSLLNERSGEATEKLCFAPDTISKSVWQTCQTSECSTCETSLQQSSKPHQIFTSCSRWSLK